MYSLHDIEVNGLDLAEVLECESRIPGRRA